MKRKKIFILIFTFMIMLIMFSSLSLASSDVIVALDPGHGGNDPGAIGGNLKESDLNWKIASRVKEILDATPGITGVLTKSQYETLDSENDRKIRAERAVANNADLLVSFHINSNASSNSMSGAEVYITGYTAEDRFYKNSNILGLDILSNLRGVGVQSHSPKPIVRIGADWDKYPDGSVADYYGIISWPVHMGIPGMIVEHAFINNPYDRANYLNDTMINRMAEADAQAIIKNKELFRTNKENNFTNSSIDSLTINSAKTHLTGEATIVDWINGVQRVPAGIPSIQLKSTDDTTTIDCYVTQIYGNKYYFDTYLSGIDSSKQYNIEISTPDRNNIPTNYTSRPGLGTERKLGEDNSNCYYIRDSKLVIEGIKYVGDVTSEIEKLEVNKQNGSYYITGEIMAIEWVNGKSTVPRKTPDVVLKSTDGTITRYCYVRQISGNTYYFDQIINGIDISKEYIMEISSSDSNNLSTNKTQLVNLSKFTSSLGRYEDKSVVIKDNKLTFEPYTYIGNLNTELYQFNKGEQNGAAYVSGEIVVVEWVDGKSTVPTKTPKMRFVSTDGTVDMEVFVTPTGTNTYYFDRYIEGIDTSKEYKFMVESTDQANVSEYNKVPVYFKGKWDYKTIGDYHGLRMKLQNNSIVFTDYTYIGNLNTELYQFNKAEQNGAAYVSGEIIVVEWVDGKSTVPTKTPKMRFVSTDGTVDMEVFVTPTGTNTYYFDRYIEGIDTSKEYKFIVESTDPNNVSEYNKVPVYFKGKWEDKVIGNYHDTQIKLSNNCITFINENLKFETKKENDNEIILNNNYEYELNETIIITNTTKEEQEKIDEAQLIKDKEDNEDKEQEENIVD